MIWDVKSVYLGGCHVQWVVEAHHPFFFFFFFNNKGKKKAVYLVVNEDFREKFVLFITIEMQ